MQHALGMNSSPHRHPHPHLTTTTEFMHLVSPSNHRHKTHSPLSFGPSSTLHAAVPERFYATLLCSWGRTSTFSEIQPLPTTTLTHGPDSFPANKKDI